jgi:hypothetical protein
MATKAGQVTLNGRFPEGAHVALIKVRDESVLRSEGGELVATGKVKDGSVVFKSGVEVGARYIATGYVDGQPREVRVRGNRAGEESAVLTQAPQGPARVRLADGSWADEAPERIDTPDAEVGPHVAQSQVPEGTPQASDTETGRAVPIIAGPVRQEDVPDGVAQRSDTETGVATVIPSGDAVDAQREKESSLAKATRGEPGRAAAEPLSTDKAPAQKDLKELDVADANVATAKKGTAEKVEKAVAQDKPSKK